MCQPVFSRPTTRALVLKAPCLPRRLAACARMNLNKLWEELEELYRDRTSSTILTLTQQEEQQQNRDNEERERSRQNRDNEERERRRCAAAS